MIFKTSDELYEALIVPAFLMPTDEEFNDGQT